MMNKYATPEIADRVYAIGTRDWSRRIFDAIAPTPLGTSYNSYLIKGETKNALIDTNHKGFESEFSGKIDQILGSHKIDYIIMNHAEPDHAGLIPHILAKSDAIVLASEKGVKLAQLYYKVPGDRIKAVADDETIDLGGKTLRFIMAPHLHWPETMFTYLPEHKILFSCDFFSAHNTTGWFDDEAEDVLMWAKKYYAEIMMPLSKMGKKGMDKIKNIDIGIIAPSHGPIYRHPQAILDAYRRWTSEETRSKALVVYVSMYHTVEGMVRTFVEGLMTEGIEVRVVDLVKTDPRELAGDLLDARALVLGTPTLLGNIHPLSMYALNIIKTLRPPLKYGVIINSYGWGKGAIKKALGFLEEARIEAVGTIEVNGSPTENDQADILNLAAELSDKIRSDDK
jgi:flavorubredoxin